MSRIETTWGGVGGSVLVKNADSWPPSWTFRTIVPGDRARDLPSKQSPSPQHPLWAPGASVPALAFQSLQLQASVLAFGAEGQPVSYRRGLEPEGCDPLPIKRLCRKASRCSSVSSAEGTTVQGLTRRRSIFPGSVPGSVLHGPRPSGWMALYVLERFLDGRFA